MTTFCRRMLPVLVLLAAAVFAPVGHTQTTTDQLAALEGHLEAALQQLDAGDPAAARSEFQAFDDGWFDIEDGVRAQSPTSYRAIEEAMAEVSFSLRADPVDADAARAAVQRLRGEIDAFLTAPAAAPPAPSPAATSATVSFSANQVQQAMRIEQIRGHLDASLRDLAAGGAELAREHVEHAIKEEFALLQPDLAATDADLAERLRQALTSTLTALNKPDAAQSAAAAAVTDDLLDDVADALFVPSIASDLRFRSSVVAGLVELAADEYAEAVVAGTVKEDLEYQNAYIYLQRAGLLWRGFRDQVRATAATEYAAQKQQFRQLQNALPTLVAPAQPVPAEHLSAQATQLAQRLEGATGALRDADSASPADQLRALSQHLDDASDALRRGDLAAAKAAAQQFDDGWIRIEDLVRAKSREHYLAIERALGDLKSALVKPDRPDSAAAAAALRALDEAVDRALPALR